MKYKITNLILGDFYYDKDKVSNEASFKMKMINEVLTPICKCLEDADEFTMLTTLIDTRIPLIRCRHELESIELDLTFSNGFGVENTNLLKYFFELQPVALKLSMFMKVWFSESKQFPKISNFMLAILVVFYLQVNDYLPSVFRLLDDEKDVEISCKDND